MAPTHFHSTSSCSLMVPSSVMSTTMTCGRVVKKSVMSHVTVPTASELRPRSSVTWGWCGAELYLVSQPSPWVSLPRP